MRIEKVFNNNVVQVVGQNDLEYIVMGKGLGFQKKAGDLIEADKIEKKFVLEEGEETQELYRVYLDLPTEQMELFLNIITFAEAVLGQSFEPSLFIALADHLQYAIQRSKEGLALQNPLAWEVRKFYPREYEIGRQALRLIKHDLGVDMAEDEAASVALHFVNAQKEGGLVEKNHQLTQIVVDILEIVRLHFGSMPTADSISYNRFVTHVQYFAQRVVNGLIQGKNDAFLFDQVQINYPQAFLCTQKVKSYVESANPEFEMSQDEQVYLTIHIQRLEDSI
ncbi:BglG family transcription antiterminator LicT [Streptococcus loxodontisalivarius]|uniref:Beta-glucoside operon transcriptional antiterminator n=1 Tax=Streptococcus loxodontisalivarius TaxID=1349415 RepID=A0ABS2PSC8_9STRE|nr:PRD domain-containing protein [Streptococcus loxodontisalivarius]MBM7642946.1 beta-glucoside operon transcriptional antiterminator [Streptococcus loxodontisalivarius]